MNPKLFNSVRRKMCARLSAVVQLPVWITALSLAMLPATPLAWGQSPQVKIMPLGDSLTYGSNDINYPNGDIPGAYRKELAARLASGEYAFDFVGGKSGNAAAGMDPDHEGTPGIRTDEVLANISTLLAPDPAIVLLMLGTNDILQGVPVANAAANLTNLIEQIAGGSPARRIYVATIPPISGTVNWNGQTPAQLNANANLYNTQVRDLVRQHAEQGWKVTLVDMSALLVLTDPDPANNFFQPGDGIHPGQAGYNQLGALWFNAITANGSWVEPPVSGLPVAPTALTVTVASPSRINLAWADAATNETIYRIRRRVAGAGVWEEIAVLPANTTRHQVTGLTTGLNSYAFAVLASNARGDSAWSEVVFSPAHDDRAFLKFASASSVFNNLPQYAAAKGNDGSFISLWASGAGVSHYWQVDLSAAHHLQQVRVITRQDSDVVAHRKNFEIRASNDPAFGTYSVLAAQGATPLAFRATFTADVTNPAPFRYVRVAKTDGTSFAITLVQVSGADLVALPAAPANLSAAAVDASHVRLGWNVISSNESGFKLERKTGAGGIWSVVATPAAAASGFMDSGLSAATAYIYRLRATNESGDSAATAEVAVTTAATPAYGLWTAAYPEFSALPAAGKLPSADANGDGTVNLLAYAFGLDPMARPASGVLPGMAAGSSGDPVYRFRRNKAAPDLVYEILATSDLRANAWTVLNPSGATIADVAGSPGVEEVSVPVVFGNSGPQRFFRLRVVKTSAD